MNDLENIGFTSSLFKNNLITRTDLEKFRSQEIVIQKLINFKFNVNEKREVIELRKLELLRKKVETANDMLKKINCIDIESSSILSHKSKLYTAILNELINSSTEELLLNYSKILPVKLKFNLKKQIENIKKED